MAKYSEKNVVKIKKDILIASEELALVNEAKEEALVALSELGKSITDERRRLSTVRETYAVELQKWDSDRNKLRLDVSDLQQKKNLLDSQINVLFGVLKDTIERITDQNAKAPDLLNSLVNKSVSILENLTNKRRTEEIIVGQLKEEHSRLESTVSLIKNTETAYQESLSSVKSELALVTKELEQAKSTIREISNREHDVRVMETRLKPAYQEFINKRANELRDKKVRG